MKAARLASAGLDKIEIVDMADPTPGPGQVLLRMKAASVNFRDLAVAAGKYAAAKLPLVPLSDGVGVVEAVGEGVTSLKIGERVAPIYALGWLSGPPSEFTPGPALGGELDGVMRQKMVVNETAAVKVPAHLTDHEAATLTVAGVTAWFGLFNFGQLKPGETVLIEGTGGVALFALQFAKLAGARVAIVSSSDEKLEQAKALGADVTVNYATSPEWGGPIKEATGGVDLVIETVGASTLGIALSTVNKGARVAQVGLMSGVGASLPLQFFIPRAVQMRGINVGGRDAYEQMNKAISLHKMRPVVGDRFAFDQLGAALGRVAKGGHFGKIVLDID
jgi:NADPH:quinone reductase-like Zn-dependent oxidoreductase